ncbi:adenosylcobinamide hydrolase [Halalkaliarchaeum desulfuricum]|uniref:Adenosylcobinamide hydrolase n=1 Tax=Halalkaliarchaeum desulfuricum TaxID=2055893 RepID=A0A343TL46_9EURY|nr:adenosylcobinamide amidohydrolase [Halalkaliarchaeum desulfuricum]AUX09818.1 adenosylcobinamide hydrolase [Halalkaliarchaeum desulfuricum]
MFEARTNGGILEIERPETVWLSTGWRGGRRVADAAYSVTVPDGWHPDEIALDVADRLAAAGVVDLPADEIGRTAPILLTGVDAENARGARLGPVEAYATAGVSNLAELPMDPVGTDFPDGGKWDRPIGTVNLVVGTTAALSEGALANLVAVAAEAKAATLCFEIGAPGTTSDAVVVAADPSGPETGFSGSATPVGNAARACVREAVRASLHARYGENPPPSSVDRAEYGIVTDARAEVFSPE